MKNTFGTENDSIYEYDDLYEEYGTDNDNQEAVDEENQNSDDVYEEYVTRYATYSKSDKSSGGIKGSQLPKKKWCILLIGLLLLILAIAVVLSLYFTSTSKDTENITIKPVLMIGSNEFNPDQMMSLLPLNFLSIVIYRYENDNNNNNDDDDNSNFTDKNFATSFDEGETEKVW